MSKLKYKVGDRVLIKDIDWYNKYKDEDGVVLCGEFVFLEDMKKFCSETLTISEDVDDGYLMLEDYHGYVWTDEMFERLVEEECPQDFIEKYCKSCGTQRCDRTKQYLNGCPYYNAYRCKKQNNATEKESKSCTNINDVKMWISRDLDGTLVLSNRQPYLPNKCYDFFVFGDDASIYYLDRNMFPEITFENSPMEVELVIKK